MYLPEEKHFTHLKKQWNYNLSASRNMLVDIFWQQAVHLIATFVVSLTCTVFFHSGCFIKNHLPMNYLSRVMVKT